MIPGSIAARPGYGVILLAVSLQVPTNSAFVPQQTTHVRQYGIFAENQQKPTTSSYDETDVASQGLVSSLTSLVNSFSRRTEDDTTTAIETDEALDGSIPARNPPTSVAELQDRLRADYTVNNYLWTGDLDLDCFDRDCTFQDPTLAFEGTDTFQTNTQNLVPFVERLVQNYQSILLDIQATPDYVETRWNMVGELNALFWKPKIDVIGRTKFWFKEDSSSSSPSLQVYKYDEEWEIPAYQALLQLVTPAGTFPNSSLPAKEGSDTMR